MKKVIVVLALFAFGFSAQAQSKVGHINITELVDMMPQKDSLEKVYANEQTQWENLLKQKEQEFYQKQAELAAMQDSANVSPVLIEVMKKDLQQMQAGYQQLQQEASMAMQKKNQELLTPLLEMVQTAIEAVAKEQGYDYVLDASSQGVMLYSDPSNDLMDAVKKQLGL